MDPLVPYIYPLSQAEKISEEYIGGKASKLAKLVQSGFRVPDGFCISSSAYQQFVKSNYLDTKIKFEIGRKKFETMRWEEIWDSALRIRSAFQKAEFPGDLKDKILEAFTDLGVQKKLVVRSSAPKEDSSSASYAGLHESYVGIEGEDGLLNAIRLVWASLWSDGALLYQQELSLDPINSTMAVLVQELHEENISGVAFGCDPVDLKADRCIIEAVAGLCSDLVDGTIDPDRWILKRSTGETLDTIKSREISRDTNTPLLENSDLKVIYQTLQSIETTFGWQPDMEWTGKDNHFTLLQARPITTVKQQKEDDKAYYLTLRPGQSRLKALAKRVSEELIPQLEAEGERLANEDISEINDRELANVILQRRDLLKKWKDIYWDDFIPFAHGVRHLATYYNDAVNPADPYEFVGLLKGQVMISTQRNKELIDLARHIKTDPKLMANIRSLISQPVPDKEFWLRLDQFAEDSKSAKEFLENFRELLDRFLDISYKNQRVKSQPANVLSTIIELSISNRIEHFSDPDQLAITELEQTLFKAVGEKHQAEASEILELGRLSWRLRDDDNLLVGRIESQLLRAITEGAERLYTAGRLEKFLTVTDKSAELIANALCDPGSEKIILPDENINTLEAEAKRTDTLPRQLVGQPASPGLVSGKVRIIRTPADLGKFKAGEILVCDAIQPNMTHLVPLTLAIIERRGGMLIHGAIIAREMDIPCVNGVSGAAEILNDGDIVTVDGFLGIVTVGITEFNLEKNL